MATARRTSGIPMRTMAPRVTPGVLPMPPRIMRQMTLGERTPDAGIIQAACNENSEQTPCQDEVVKMSRCRKFEGPDHGWINSQKPLWTIGEGIEIIDQYPDDLSKPQCDDGQIIPAHTQDRDTEQCAAQSSKGRTRGDHHPEGDVDLKLGRGQKGITVCPDSVKGDISQVKKTRKPHHHVEADPQHDIDADISQNMGPVVPDERGKDSNKAYDQAELEPSRHRQNALPSTIQPACSELFHHALSATTSPMIPRGRKIKIKTRKLKAMTTYIW